MNTSQFAYRMTCTTRPPKIGDGQLAFMLPEFLVRKKHELALTISLMTHRRLFGEVYAGIQPDYFFDMRANSGIYLSPTIPISDIRPDVRYPGDIDLLVLPYEGETLILDRVIAIEIKIIRATYAKQGKSPNDFGVSQAKGLLALGFPYVALMHLIVSDDSPQTAWRDMGMARVIDKNGRVEILPSMPVDWLPIDLMERSFGRLATAAPPETGIGLVAAYLDADDARSIQGESYLSTWIPRTRRAPFNQQAKRELLEKIAEIFARQPQYFLDTPRFDPT